MTIGGKVLPHDPEFNGSNTFFAEQQEHKAMDQFMKDKEQMVINPGEYSLVKEFGTTKYYQVKELNSGVVFNADFYFYGGIISGWSVEPGKDYFDKYANSFRK